VATQIDTSLLLEFVGEIVHQPHVEVFAAEESVAVRRLHLEHAVADFENGDIEHAAAEIIDRNRAGLVLVEPVGKRGRRRLTDDPQRFESRDLAGVLGGLPLGVVEIGGNCNDGLLDLGSEIGFRRFLHFPQNECRNLRGRIALALDLHPGVAIRSARDLVGNEFLVPLQHWIVVTASDEALDGENRVLGVGGRLALGRLTDEPLALVRKRDDGRRRAHSLRVLDNLRSLAFHHGDARICGSEIDADDLGHGGILQRHF
jgi:hypothetical protein